jgi:ABC-type lipoprotein export system ATPase subunit
LPDPVVVCRGVGKIYPAPGRPVEALAPLDLTVAPGSLVALIGPSGCGKSTLLRLLASLESVDSGSLQVAGADLAVLHGSAMRSFRRDTVAYVSQRAAESLVPRLSLREHVDGAGVGILAGLGLESKLDRVASRLSGGEQARGAIGVALARSTPVIVSDEPTAELDDDSVELVLVALRGAVASGRTVIVATHDPHVVAAADVTVELPRPQRRDISLVPRNVSQAGVVLEVDGLTKRYGDRSVVDDVDLSLGAGEIGVLLGRSGSGKSTLLMMIGGWVQMTSGSISIGGRPAPDVPGWDDVAYVPQRFGLLPELTVRENVELSLRGRGRTAVRDLDSLFDELDLGELAERFPGETSLGQRQRIAIARALLCRSTLLLADEPTSHQDAHSALLVWAAIRRAADEGTACLIASNDDTSADYGERVVTIADGRIVRH